MGKGDKKTKRGKIIMGSYGVRRPKKSGNLPTPGLNDEKVTPKNDAAKEPAKEKKKSSAKVASSEKTVETVGKKETVRKKGKKAEEKTESTESQTE